MASVGHVAVGLAIGLAARWLKRPAGRAALFASVVLASHPVLDTMTDGGLGCALLWPFDFGVGLFDHDAKLKKDLIEFHLNGGGFGTFGDDTSTSAGLRTVDKSNREKDLEKQVRDEKDPKRRERLKDELDELKGRRERENRRIEIEGARLEEIKRERIAEQRLRGGSRFNLRFAGDVPAAVRPEDVMTALRAKLSRSHSRPVKANVHDSKSQRHV